MPKICKTSILYNACPRACQLYRKCEDARAWRAGVAPALLGNRDSDCASGKHAENPSAGLRFLKPGGFSCQL
jgi:hypothetical protein